MYLQIVCLIFFCLNDIVTAKNITELQNYDFKDKRVIRPISADKMFENEVNHLFMQPINKNSTSLTSLKNKRRNRKKKRRKIKTETVEHRNNSSVLVDSSPSMESKKKIYKKRKRKHQSHTLKTNKTEMVERLNNYSLIHDPKSNLKILNSLNSTMSKKRKRCSVNNGGCAQICKLKGKKKCACLKGYVLTKNRKKCVDLNECRVRNGECQDLCRNTLGSYFCNCHSGFRLTDDLKSCQDVNECHLRNGHGPCQDTCINTHGSYTCACSNLNGSRLSMDKHSCEDIDECKELNPGCSHLCINTRHGAYCNCPEGMELMSDYKTCQDVDECEDTLVKLLCQRGCINTIGSYYCEEDFQNDFSLKKVLACPPLDLPQHGFITCQRNNSFESYTKNGRRVIKNSPGTKCLLECPVGFRLLGEGRFICDINGKWITKKKGTCIISPYPKLQCPPDQLLFLKENQLKILVQFPAPRTNIRWKIVESYPTWAKDLKGELGKGHHNIQFSVTDPASKLSSTCFFKIIVKK